MDKQHNSFVELSTSDLEVITGGGRDWWNFWKSIIIPDYTKLTQSSSNNIS